MSTSWVNELSCEDRVLFPRCIDKVGQIKHLLETVAEFLDPTYVLDPSGVVRIAFVEEDYTKRSRWPLQIRPSRTQPRG